MKNRRIVLLLLMCALCLPLPGLASEAPYATLTETYDGYEAFSPNGYLPDVTLSEFDGKALKRPADLFVDENDCLFISDEGNKRVILCTAEGALIRVFGKGTLKSPAGLYARQGKLYVADTKLEQVLVYDVATGEQIFAVNHPGTVLYGLKNAFKPLKVAADMAGSLYVISKGNTNGIAQFSADGTFLGYFGANETNLSLIEKLQRLTYTQEQLNNLKRNIPSTPTSLDMDARGLVYTVTTGIQGIKRLNMSGRNIMERTNWGFTYAVDTAVSAQETIFVINEVGYIMEYSRDGRVLFNFGGTDTDRTRIGLFVSTVAIDVDSQGRLYVLDRDKAIVQRFEITEYARLVHNALSLYQQGLYAESQTPWEQVLSLNSMFDYAQMGLDRAYYKLERYEEALLASRLGGDRDGYSDAYWEIRNVWLQKNILYVIGALLLFLLLHGGWKRLRVKWTPAIRLTNGLARVGDVKLLRELRFMTYFIKNPADAYYGVKKERKVSVLSATVLYVATFLFFVASKYASGFLFKNIQDGRYEVGMDFAVVIGGIALFLIACNLICSIREGEGTFKQMYCGMAYALTPYLLLMPIRYGLSYILTYNEAFLITLMDVLMMTGCFILIVMMVKSLQNYTFRETFANLLLTLFTMLMIVIALVIGTALVAQLWEFITSVWKEAIFYYEG